MSATISLSIDHRTGTPIGVKTIGVKTIGVKSMGVKIGHLMGQWIGPKVALWIGFAVLSSTWYALDPEAHGNGYQALSQSAPQTAPAQTIERVATDENPARVIMSAMH